MGIIGQAATPFIALALIPGLDDGWRWLFIIGGVIAVMARFELPKSPRWLAPHVSLLGPAASGLTLERICS